MRTATVAGSLALALALWANQSAPTTVSSFLDNCTPAAKSFAARAAFHDPDWVARYVTQICKE